MKNILIVDDHVLLRHGLMKIIDEHFTYVTYGEAGTAAEALELAGKQKWDIVLLDINLPGRNGLETVKDFKAFDPELPILVISMYPEDQFAVRVIKAGASGYLTKDSAPENLVMALNNILAGHKYITSSVAELLVTELSGDSRKAPHESLSNRQFQVLRLIASGKTITEIAKKLSLSVKTISTYRMHILEKLNMKNNAQLITYAVRNNLTD
ncbi:MAG: response regulator transcription factor [Candidatus Marinimicrobia bacterium]|nr:response regulator transcription factor [Candidatus Neomarinimicrobiota bacterium]